MDNQTNKLEIGNPSPEEIRSNDHSQLVLSEHVRSKDRAEGLSQDSTQTFKPQSEIIRPELTRLPHITTARRAVRSSIKLLLKLLAWLLTETKVTGSENIPEEGAGLIVSNHLGDADALVSMVYARRDIEILIKVELYDIPVVGKIMDAYGVIWVHRGHADRRALRAALDGLSQERLVAIAPEGRESLTGALEEGTNGAAYLALKSGVPIIPVTFTGTENKVVFANLKRLKRTKVTITVGKPFYLELYKNERIRQPALNAGTERIMRTLASQLPPEYRGVYQ